MTPSEPLILTDIAKRVGRGGSAKTVLDGLSVRFEPGALTMITGASGAGKTTLLSVAGMLTAPSAGEIRLGDLISAPRSSAGRLARQRRKAFGYLFQNAGLMGRMSALDNAIMPLRYSAVSASERRRRGLDALEQVGLSGAARRTVDQLSGGERHRVAMARLIAHAPPWMICDEPTTGLDAGLGAQIVTLLRGFADAGHGVIAASHDPAVSARADHRLDLGVSEPRLAA
ncbi:MAG: ABC transporter ATP-binding protein [Maricaulaceae bacterium]